ncbi:radical SAM protein, partial [Nanoarchaeota archaeon]
MRKKIKNVILELNSSCNNNCLYCYIPQEHKRTRKETPSSFFEGKLKEYRKKGVLSVDFTGGEPTLYKNLENLVKFARKIGYKKRTLVSNGRLLSYKKFLERLIDAGVNRIVIPFDSHDPKIMDATTRTPRSFAQVVKAIGN